jgi:two-component system, chemotaxis family, CheB/CheR fusion protein
MTQAEAASGKSRKSAKAAQSKSSSRFDGYIVGIGASAGGLDALERFFHEMPVDSGAAFVVIQHLSPDHKSMMANLLSRHTKMPVLTVEDAMRIEPNVVYLIPPGALMSVAVGQLRLSPKNPRGLSLPIDLFFNSLAQEYDNHAIGVILSGTGSDGTRGAVAINAAGGLLLAQDPETCKFDGMPRSAIVTGLVDEVLPPESLGPRILDHIRHVPHPTLLKPEQPDSTLDLSLECDSPMEEILHLLHQQGGVDFRDYKPATVVRRIERRMQVRHVPDLDNYLKLLRGDRSEALTLRREILIPVTNFFRDTESFDVMAKSIINLVRERDDGQPLRVWVAGTSTGEEAYSIAILFAEAFEQIRRWPNIKIFATDVEQQNIEAAGAGAFSESITAEVSPERLERFFFKRGNHFVVKSEIRQNIVFARHNLLEDPPFTRMDLVTCRNVLIYFKSAAQERALRRMQYALASNGTLFLGSSESLGALQQDFSPVSSKHKIYRILRHVSLPLESAGHTLSLRPGLNPRQPSGFRRPGPTLDALAIDAGQQILLGDYVPPSLLVNGRHELVHVFGAAQRYLVFPPGNVSLELVRLLPSRLAPIAVALLHKAAKDREPIHSDSIAVELASGDKQRVHLVARPVSGPEIGEPMLLLTIESEPLAPETATTGIATINVGLETSERMAVLERELAATRDSLQATIEELETANEELQATNEELMASNEELQSSNEELQSVNEELYTVNAENQEKIEILNRLNADLDSMAKAATIATLFVDDNLRLTRFTAEASQLFKIREGDVGRSLDDFSHLLEHPDFIGELRHTLQTGTAFEQEINARDGKCYLTRILPYTLPSGQTRSAVVSFIDVTSLSDVNRLQAILDALPERVVLLDQFGEISLVNAAWRAFSNSVGDPDMLRCGAGCNYLEAGQTGNWFDEDALRQVNLGLTELLNGKRKRFDLDYVCQVVARQSGSRDARFHLSAAAIKGRNGGVIVSHSTLGSAPPDA